MSPNQEALKDLLRRVEAATGPDRELDRDIHAALGLDMKLVVHGGAMWNLYTASLDAALALVERVLPGWDCSVVRLTPAPCEGYVWPRGDSLRQHIGRAPTPALALLAALLRALDTQQSGEPA